jgi:hypothetical protein
MNPLHQITVLILKLITSISEETGIKLIKKSRSIKLNHMLLRRTKD